MDARQPREPGLETSPGATQLWKEWPLYGVVLAVFLIYFVRLPDLTIRGEESRRATVAMEMLETGDWVVQRQQGSARFMSSRPPLQSWLIAGVGWCRGEVDEWATRLPSACAILLTCLLIYAYGRTFLSKLGAATAAVAYASMPQVMELGRLGETDALFALFVSSSLLLWHWGERKGWPSWQTWMTGYLFAALATLTKGPQGPVYFAVPVGLYLLVMRKWRFAFSRAHLLGIGTFACVFGAWFVPFYLSQGVSGVRHTFTGDVSLYTDFSTGVIKHYLIFPLRIFATLFPWSVLLLLYIRRDLRHKLGSAATHAVFLSGAVAIALPTVWAFPGSRTRFLLSLYPCFAVLVGIAAEKCLEQPSADPLRRICFNLRALLAGIMVLIGAGMPLARGLAGNRFLAAQPWGFVVVASLALLGLGILSWKTRGWDGKWHFVSIFGLAAFAGLMIAGIFTNYLIAKSRRADLAVQELCAKLPPHSRLVSFGEVFSLFAYYYAEPIPRLDWDAAASVDAGTLFCTMQKDLRNLHRPYETLAVINCSREIDEHHHRVVVGRLLGPAARTARKLDGPAR